MKTLVIILLMSLSFQSQAQKLRMLQPALYPAIDLSVNGRDSMDRKAKLFKQALKKMEDSFPLSEEETEIFDYVRDREDDLAFQMLLERGYYYFVGNCFGCCYYENGGPDSIWSSSTLKGFKADAGCDETLDKAWAEGKAGSGIGESISFKMVENAWAMEKIIIYNGYQKDIELWKKNNRVKQLKLYVDKKPVAILQLEDITNGQIFDVKQWFPERRKPYLIRLEILSVYKGDKHDDTVISEIVFDGQVSH